MQSRIMFLEAKAGLTGMARIGRVELSKSGKTLRYRGAALQSLKGQGFKANYIDMESGAYYWVSGPRRDGRDCLCPGLVEIDEDVREEYWTTIRAMPASKHLTSFRSPGKYDKRRPR